MNDQSNRFSVFFLVGCTAVGKSATAQFLAEQNNYSILSADSMLVYKGMDIGTAKPSKEERKRVQYYGIDIATPDMPFSVWDFKKHALTSMANVHTGSSKMIVVGGSGLYINALTKGLKEGPGANHALRAHWESILKSDGITTLQKTLQQKAPELYDSLPDKQNARRLIRALEKAEDKTIYNADTDNETSASPETPLIGLRRPVNELNLIIESRVKEIYSQGFIEEVRDLLEKWHVLSITARQAIGYSEAIDFLEKRCSKDEALARTITRTKQFAKRQRTWFKHQSNVVWIDIDKNMEISDIASIVEKHWRQYGPTPVKT